jgi:RNA recognition motif-containing protein
MKTDDACTLFIRNLTKQTTREELASIFSNDYVVKHSIIIHERNGGPSKGFGFVTFALESDCKEAKVRNNFYLHDKKLKLDFASSNKQENGELLLIGRNVKMNVVRPPNKERLKKELFYFLV